MDLKQMMNCLENDLKKAVASITASHQLAAFCLSVLTEEKFRCYGMSGSLFTQSSFTGHIQLRDYIFALEWALRCLKLPDSEFILIDKLRKNYRDKIASTAITVLNDALKYAHVRDLVICTNRGGYIVEFPENNTIVFRDNPSWPGTSDMKSRLIGDRISAERDTLCNVKSIDDLTLDKTSAYNDFPHNIRGEIYIGSDFWALWNCLFEMCKTRMVKDSAIRDYGAYAATSKTNELCILITKKRLLDHIYSTTGIKHDTIQTFLSWLSFNSETERKFSLFHCPLIEINEKFHLILPNVIMLSHVPTIFLRLLAHHDKQVYDAYSTDMEKSTLRHLKDHLEGAGRILKTNVKIDASNKPTEIDFVEFDRNNSILTICQAKFTIRADSVAEVNHSNSILSQGVDQLKKNKETFDSDQSALMNLCSKLGISNTDILQTQYFLLPIRFTGSDYLDIPEWITCLPVEFCLRPKYMGKSLDSIVNDYRSLWDSITFSKNESTFDIGSFKITFPGFSMPKQEST